MCTVFFRRMIAKAAVSVLFLTAGCMGFGQDDRTVLTGTVNDQFGTPMANVAVVLSSIERVLQTKSTANGQFRFEGVPGGTYDLEFAARGFIKQKISIDLPNRSAPLLNIVLKVGSQPDTAECGAHPVIRYDSPGSGTLKVTGVVRDYESRRPLAHAEVTLSREDDAKTTATAVADKKGGFQFNSLPAGRYQMSVSRDGYLAGEVKPLLVPRENSVVVDIPIVRNDGKLIICQ